MSLVQYEVRENIAEVMFNNPPVNAITDAFMDGLMAALERARIDDDVRAVIIGSAVADRFCAGLDLGSFLKSSSTQVHDLVEKIYAKLCDVQFNLDRPRDLDRHGQGRGLEDQHIGPGG